jgi:hypothetical protein
MMFLQKNKVRLMTRMIHVGGKAVAVELPSDSLCAFVFKK